ncbi:MAG: hypothetical protein AB1649_07230 [Chloroflexota bacterium]
MVTTVETIPLETDADGVIHVSNTRVTLDTVVTAFDVLLLAVASDGGYWEGQIIYLPLR